MPVFNNVIAGAAGQSSGGGAGGDSIASRSLRFDDEATSNLSQTFSAGNQKKWTWSAWVKRGKIVTNNYHALFTAPAGGGNDGIFFRNDAISVSYGYSGNGIECYTSSVFRDSFAWYHIVVAVDSDQSTAADRLKIWVNGQLHTLNQYPGSGNSAGINANSLHHIGLWKNGNSTNYAFNGYLADIYFVDGQQLAPTDFAQTNSTTDAWEPKAFSGTYGTNGFHLNFANNTSTTTLGNDAAGSNDWTLTGFSLAAGSGYDSMADAPLGSDASSGNNSGNYAVLNSAGPFARGCTFKNGNLDVEIGTGANSTNNDGIRAISSIGMTSGKWYFEHVITGGSTARSNVGVVRDIENNGWGGNHWIGSRSSDWIVWSNNGDAYNNGSSDSYGTSWTTNDVIGCAFDADEGKLYIYKNGTIMNSGTPAHTGLTNGPYFFIAAEKESNISVNFGQRPFTYAPGATGGPPATYKALCTHNLADPPIPKSADHFDTKLYEGTGASHSLTGTNNGHNFRPDFIWVKSRSNAASHALIDRVRGNGDILRSDNSNDEVVNNYSIHTSFLSDGFTLGADDTNGWSNWDDWTYISSSWNAGTANSTTSKSAGDLNSSFYNDDRSWSSGITNQSSAFDQAASNAFNGSRSNKLRTADNAVLVTLNFNPALSVSNTIQILGEDYPTADFRYTVTVGGTTYTKDAKDGKPATFDVSGNLTQITVKNNSNSGRTYLEWIKVDGEELIDSNETPPNLPSLASSYLASPTSGVSIISYTGNGSASTVAHGLNAEPHFWIMKSRSHSDMWVVRHRNLPNTEYLQLDDPAQARNAISDVTGDAYADSAVLPVGAADANNNTRTYICYAFAPIEGFSKFGKFTSGADPFIYLGFSPEWVLIKRTDSGAHWYLYTPASGDGEVQSWIEVNNNDGVQTYHTGKFQFFSNGFQPQGSDVDPTGEFVYAAFARHPFKTATAR